MFIFFKGIVILFTAITLPFSGLFAHAKPVAKPKVAITASPTPIRKASPTPLITPKIGYDAKTTQIPTFVLPTNTPTPTVAVIQTYSILSLSQLVNMNGANSQSVSAAYDAYNTFLRTPNLAYMTPAQQQALFAPILTAAVQNVVNQQKAQLQEQLNTVNQQYSSPTPTLTQNSNQTPNVLQTCINNKIATINSNPYLSESSREAEVANAPQACANQQ